MDTVEKLGGTYFYAGMERLSAGELFFWIFVDKTMQQLGVADVGAVAAIVSGMAILPTRQKPADAKEGTSLASVASRKVFGNAKFPFGIRLPTFIGNPVVERVRRKMVANIGTFVGRTVPVVGWFILAYDVSRISAESVITYNKIVRVEDRLW
ncbi:hypothetical protein OSR40_010120 [Serratia rubidaea]|uniref:STM2901 family protein n=1 Tax=Serratia rubidaea TaxID=61652 RepID=UPI0023AF717A|nr:hypothetical protein [Serratia rubidaea]MDK1704084.1 hypothetical protein [Serratia rubidaea]